MMDDDAIEIVGLITQELMRMNGDAYYRVSMFDSVWESRMNNGDYIKIDSFGLSKSEGIATNDGDEC